MKNGCSFLFSHQMAEVSQISSSSGWSYSKKWEQVLTNVRNPPPESSAVFL